MSAIAPIIPSMEISQIPDITSFSTSGSSSAGFLDEAMSSLVAKDTKNKNAVTDAVQAMSDNPDPAMAVQAQQVANDYFLSRNLGSSILAKFKATFEKVVLNSQ